MHVNHHALSIRTETHINMPRRDSPGFQVTKGACSFQVVPGIDSNICVDDPGCRG